LDALKAELEQTAEEAGEWQIQVMCITVLETDDNKKYVMRPPSTVQSAPLKSSL
jgi:hypothetical protein